jgi:hypothetical protein
MTPGAFQKARVGFGRLAAGLISLALAFPSGASWATLVINEFLPDPEGSDGGREFVELLNTGPEPESLADVQLQFANGAEGAVWSTRWTGESDFLLDPEQRFLIVDRNWMGEPAGQAEVYLGLQNGPDAVRLIRGPAVLDLVGYGPLTDLDMMEGDPADVAAGLSLSRRPDGVDTADNRADFVLAEPTPGSKNFFPYSLHAIAWELDPPSLDRTFVPVRFSLELNNNGTEVFPVGPLLLRFDGEEHAALLDRLPAGHNRRITWSLTPRNRGLLTLEVLAPLPGDTDTLVLHPASLQVGPADLILNEVLSTPGQGQGEWVEIVAAGTEERVLTGYSLRDEDGPWRPLPAEVLVPGEFLVLAQDSLALAQWHQDNQGQGGGTGCPSDWPFARHRNLTGWPTLNNTPSGERDFAERVYLSDPAGHVIDHLTLGGTVGGAPGESGISLERIAVFPPNPGASNWAVCTAATGSTPGCPNSVTASGIMTTGLSVNPQVLDPVLGISTVHFLFTLSTAQAGWEVRVFDLWGSLVRDLGGEYLGVGPRDLLWDGRDDQGQLAGPGGYVVLLEILDGFGNKLAREKVLMVVR